MTRARNFILAACVAGCVLLLWFALHVQAPEPSVSKAPEGPARTAAKAHALPSGLGSSDTDVRESGTLVGVSPYMAAHSAIAEGLGYVAIRCWVGPEYDSDHLVGAFHQEIANGWYTNVETSLAGRHGVERRYELPDVSPDAPDWERADFETLFVVSWSAQERGKVVPCEVHTLNHGELRVTVLDDAGLPVQGVDVYGCGSSAQSDASGLAVLEEAFAGEECSLNATQFPPDMPLICHGTQNVSLLAKDEVRTLSLSLRCTSPEDSLTLDILGASAPNPSTEEFSARSDEAELELFRRLGHLDLGDEGNRLIDRLVAHREDLIDLKARQEVDRIARERKMDEIEALFDRAHRADTPEEAKQLTDEALRIAGTLMSTER